MAEAYPLRDARARSFGYKAGEATLGALAAVFVAAAAFLAVHFQKPPDVLAADAAAAEFSAARALRHLEVVGRRPHPPGSAEHAAVREYLLRELAALGVEPQVQSATAVDPRRDGLVRAATVQNVVARLAGTDGGARKALLVSAHYDTVPNSPGASDDGSGVAALLETLRALTAGPPPANDIIFLFTDAEELGLLGAKAFVEEHALAKHVGLVLNFEARGAGGPAWMFETSGGNGGLVREFASSVPHPRATSLAYDIYRLLPNDTDLTVFKRANMPGMNFAYIDGQTRYHSWADAVENMDERSLQHQGSYALALARHFGSLNLDAAREPDAVYFDLLGRAVIHYPSAWALPLAVLMLAAYAAVAVYGLKKGRLSVRGIVAGGLAFLLALVSAPALVALLWWLVGAAHGWLGRGLQDDAYFGKLYFAGFVLVALAVVLFVYGRFRRVGVANLAAGALLCWLLLLFVSSVLLPGGSYLLTWPLLFGLAALALLSAAGDEGAAWRRLVVPTLCAVPGVLLLVPVIQQTDVALGTGLAWVGAALVVILSGLLVPTLAHLVSSRRWLAPGLAAAVGLLLVGAAAFNPGFSRERPKANNLFYAMNADTRRAVWASTDAAADSWTAQFLGGNAERGPLNEYLPTTYAGFLRSTAPAGEFQTSNVELLEDATRGDLRTVRLRLTSPHPVLRVSVSGETNQQVFGTTVNGRRVESGGERAGVGASAWGLQYWSPPPSGVELTLELKAGLPLALRVVDQSFGLPQLPGAAHTPRPADMMPAPSPNSDATLVSKTYTF
ncbi:MAG TPA: M28 family metallopeptidase [Pyrinomonadaceae bacterium]|nr:M28 family metallopeptidase [Pyrinomonadaceae bacterium]